MFFRHEIMRFVLFLFDYPFRWIMFVLFYLYRLKWLMIVTY